MFPWSMGRLNDSVDISASGSASWSESLEGNSEQNSK